MDDHSLYISACLHGDAADQPASAITTTTTIPNAPPSSHSPHSSVSSNHSPPISLPPFIVASLSHHHAHHQPPHHDHTPVFSTFRIISENETIRDAAKLLTRVILKWDCPPRRFLLVHKDLPSNYYCRSVAASAVSINDHQSSAGSAPTSALTSLTATTIVDHVWSVVRFLLDHSRHATAVCTDQPVHPSDPSPTIIYLSKSLESTRPANLVLSDRSAQVEFCVLEPGVFVHHNLDPTLAPPTLLPPRRPVDLVITLGGDGTVLHAAHLFQSTVVPPIVPFHLGTLGFLTVFDFGSAEERLARVIQRGCRVNIRMRFHCRLVRQPSLPETSTTSATLTTATPALVSEEWDVLNEVVLDRGSQPFMASINVFGDGRFLTTVQADGLAVATPTGSTAYSLSAGGSVVHPDVPAILLTPICPHTLSFRPILLPDSIELALVVSDSGRCPTIWASFDGRCRRQLQRGDAIIVTASRFPVPTLCRENQTADWFSSLSRCLRWNER